MGLLRDIQNDAVSEAVPLTVILRRCKVLAARLDSAQLDEWIQHELEGYPETVTPPDYRVNAVEIFGHFVGSFGKELRNAPIPPICIPEKYRDQLSNHHMIQSIAEIEDLLGKSDQGHFRAPVPANLLLLFGTKVYEGMNCLTAWKDVPRSWLVSIVNVVRGRVLDFALRVEKIAPRAGDIESSTDAISARMIQQVFNTTILGGAANVVGTASDSVLAAAALSKGDLQSLVQALKDLGFSESSIGELTQAIEDEPSSIPGKYGPKVSAWLGKAVQLAAGGGLKIGVGAAGNLLARLLAQYYGLP